MSTAPTTDAYRRALARDRLSRAGPAATPAELVGGAIDLLADLALAARLASGVAPEVVVPPRARASGREHLLGLSATSVALLDAALARDASAHGYSAERWSRRAADDAADRLARDETSDVVGLVRALGHEIAGASVALAADRMAVPERLTRGATEALLVFLCAEGQEGGRAT